MPKLNAYDAAKAPLVLLTFDQTRWPLPSPKDVIEAIRHVRGSALLGFADDYAGGNPSTAISSSTEVRDIMKAVVSLEGRRFGMGDCWLFALLAAERLDNLGFVVREHEEVEGPASPSAALDGCAEHVGLYLKNEMVLDVDGFKSFGTFVENYKYEVLSEDELLQRWRKEGGFESYMDPRDDFTLNGRCRTIIEAVAWLNGLILDPEQKAVAEKEKAELKAVAAWNAVPLPSNLDAQTLIVVHPGSMVGSANNAIGRDLAESARVELEEELKNWKGNIAILDGFLSDEISGRFGMSIENALLRARSNGFYGIRAFGCDSNDPGIDQGVEALIKGLELTPSSSVSLTGAWYDPANEEGCVNAVKEALRNNGIDATILDSALAIAPDEPEDDEEPSSGPRM